MTVNARVILSVYFTHGRDNTGQQRLSLQDAHVVLELHRHWLELGKGLFEHLVEQGLLLLRIQRLAILFLEETDVDHQNNSFSGHFERETVNRNFLSLNDSGNGQLR
jgi:hypothetical protein